MDKPDEWDKWRVKKPFVGLEYDLIDSQIWKALSNAAVRLYIEIIHKWNKENNCPYYLPFGYSDIKYAMSKPTYLSAMKELLKSGLVIQVDKPGKNHKGSYALNRIWDMELGVFYT